MLDKCQRHREVLVLTGKHEGSQNVKQGVVPSKGGMQNLSSTQNAGDSRG